MTEIRNIIGFLALLMGLMFANESRFIDSGFAFLIAALLIRVRED